MLIKANELVWVGDRAETVVGTYTIDHIPAKAYGDGMCPTDWLAQSPSRFEAKFKFGMIFSSRVHPEVVDEAKAACQAHYQRLVESMVDMGRLKRAIKNALINGNYFVDGPNEEDRTDFFIEEIEKEFKNLEQEREG